ncbi:MAG: 16S rRNA processing protein RimM [Veillonellaceae bacterium]|jgi:16S rRNA processing protein RimM|nr:16S rRNA processing protein RimM [Veillonellaceae bacterium]
MRNELIVIGQIVAPHGVRGDVRVFPHTDFPERFAKTKRVVLEDGSALDVENAKFHKQFVLVKFRNVNTMNDAEKLRGKLLHVNRQDVVPLPEGHFYHFDIIGLKVYTESGEYLGIVTDILETGSNDVYVTEQEDQKPILIPALKEVVLKIDIPSGRMTVKLQEEWE